MKAFGIICRVTRYSPGCSFLCLEARKNKRVMKVPKGTSDYQATWIINEDEKETDEESSDDDDDDGNDLMDEAMDGEDEENHSQVS